jgi:hypothetical protein
MPLYYLDQWKVLFTSGMRTNKEKRKNLLVNIFVAEKKKLIRMK